MQINELIDQCINKGIAIYCYRKPGNDIKIGISKESVLRCSQPLESTAINKACFIAVPFNSSKSYYIFPDDLTCTGNLISDNIIDFIKNYKEYDKSEISVKSKDSICQKNDYIKLVDETRKKIKSGAFEKIVFSHKSEFHIADFSASNKFMQLIDNQPNAFVSLINIPGEGVWIGATPELLLKKAGTTFQTMALAGTRSITESGNEWDDKNKKEQALVCEYIENILSKYSNHIKESKTGSVRAGHLEHRITRFEFDMEHGEHCSSLLRELHPTPAVCGTPKDICYEEILRQEHYDRELYSGFIGHIDYNSDFEFYVNLRCLKATGEDVYVYAGGGITAASDGEKEWIETELKAQTVLGR